MRNQTLYLGRTICWPNKVELQDDHEKIPLKKIEKELNSCIDNITKLQLLIEKEETKILFWIKKKKERQFTSHINNRKF